MTLNILIVEDEFVIALDLQKRLLSLGYNAKEIASNGNDAVRIAKKSKPDLILMDILIAGDKDGIDTAIEINKTMNIPVIYVTAYSDQTTLERAKNSNSFGYVTKPYNERELISTIEIAMARFAMQNELIAKEYKFRRIFESAGDQVLVLSADAKVLEANTQNKVELGYEIEEMDCLAFEKICQIRKSYLSSTLQKVLRTEEPITCNTKMIRKDQSKYPCEIRFSVFNNRDPHQFLAVIRNVSERVEAKKEHQSMLLQIAHTGKLAMLGTISAGLIHELKNPLTSIIGFSELLLNKKDTPELIANKLQIIKHAATQMKNTIDHLNVYTRQDTADDMQNTGLNNAVSGALEIVKGQVDDISINVEYTSENNDVWGNISQLEGVLQNLIINSIDSFHEHDIFEKSISIKTYTKEDRVVLDYEDNAGGMTKEVLPRVFDPFFTTKKAGRGTGLGLSILRSIMEHHKGLIYLTVKESKGTRFLLSFPKSSRYAEIDFDPHKMIVCKIEKIGKPHILLIDDDPQFTSLLESVLSEKFDVVTYNDPEKAMAQIRKDPVDLIVTDLDMPKVTGQDIIRFANSLNKHIPIIVVTGTSINSKMSQFNNVEAVVEKPISQYDKLISFILENLDED